jgi:CrcB protein
MPTPHPGDAVRHGSAGGARDGETSTEPVDAAGGPETPSAGGAARQPHTARVLAVIAVGGALGGTARYALALAMPTADGAFPWATFWTNVSGCLVLALLMVCLLDLWPPTIYVRPFFGVGFVGAYTTFSTAMIEMDELVAHGHADVAAGYLAASLAASLGAITTGLALGRALVTRRALERPGPETPSEPTAAELNTVTPAEEGAA